MYSNFDAPYGLVITTINTVIKMFKFYNLSILLMFQIQRELVLERQRIEEDSVIPEGEEGGESNSP